MTVCRHFRVSGRVQGVAYRASACQVARRLGLIGWVRNLADGRVETLACGEPSALQAFEEWLWQGPALAHVTQVLSEDASLETFTDFRVR